MKTNTPRWSRRERDTPRWSRRERDTPRWSRRERSERSRPHPFRLLALALAAVPLAGCGALSGGVYEAPLPGGADLGSHPITVSADFDDVLDLVPQSSVKVDNVAVGRVASISLNDDGRSAHVKLLVNGDVELPAGTTARLQQTSLLGEKYVALVRPAKPTAGADLADGAAIPLGETDEAAQVEQVLGALSMVLNGGGIGQFQEISRELQAVGDGRTREIKAFMRQLERFVTVLDDRRGAITDAIDGLAALSESLDADRDKIARVLEDLSPGMQVIVDQRTQLVAMLKALDRLSDVTIETLDASQKDIVADLKLLEPIIDKLAESGESLPASLEILLTYPFPDSVLGAIKGDYLNVFVTTNFRTLPDDCTASSCLWPQPIAAGSTGAGATGATGSGREAGAAGPGEGGGQGDGASDAPSPDAASPAPSDGATSPPTLLPPTSSATPGSPSPTVTVPTDGPSDGPTTDPTPSSPTSDPTPSDPTASASGRAGAASATASATNAGDDR